MKSNIHIAKDEFIDLCAVLRYNRDAQVTWKKKVFTGDEIKKRAHIPLINNGDPVGEGLSCRYTFQKAEYGKYIKFYAYIESLKLIVQTFMVYVEDKCKTNIRIRGAERVGDNSSKVSIQELVKVRVNKYTVDNSKVPEFVKKDVKWMVRVGDNKDERLVVDGVVACGDEIAFEIFDSWKGKEVLLMPYFNKHTPEYSCTLSVKLMDCKCGGPHSMKISGIGNIKSYTGNFPSPFQIMNYTPSSKEEPLLHQVFVPDSTIRSWIKDAADYHEIPHEIMAVIIQQENAPNATKWRQFLQFGERTLTTWAAQLDDTFWGIVPDRIADGSAGFMNMRRPTLKDTVSYTKKHYKRELMPEHVANRIGFIFDSNVDDEIQGADWRADLYYGAAHIRQLIDRVMGICAKGDMTLEQVEKVFASYNGSGSVAEKYGKDAINTLKAAAEGTKILYFYEK